MMNVKENKSRLEKLSFDRGMVDWAGMTRIRIVAKEST